MQRPLEREDDLEWIFLFVVQKRLRAFLNYFFTEGAIAGNGIYRKNLSIVLKSEPIHVMQKGAAARCSSP